MSRYKLIGDIWDNCKTKEYTIEKQNDINEIFEYNKSKTLLDIDSYKRKIKLSRLLGVNDADDLKQVINKVKRCDDLYVVLDYKPCTNNPILHSFYSKRLKQVNYLISSKCKNCNIHYVCN